jgi:hypothetical protein
MGKITVVDQHRRNADPNPNFHAIQIRIGIKTMPILVRILRQGLHMLVN